MEKVKSPISSTIGCVKGNKRENVRDSRAAGMTEDSRVKNLGLICKALTGCFAYFLSKSLYKRNICVPLQPANEEADFLKAETKNKIKLAAAKKVSTFAVPKTRGTNRERFPV